MFSLPINLAGSILPVILRIHMRRHPLSKEKAFPNHIKDGDAREPI